MRSIIALAGVALATVVLAAPAQGALECGDTITTDRKLKKDLVDCPGTGVFVDGDGITLDMNGHAIRGASSRGVQVITASNNVTVKNGDIRGAGQFGFFGDVVAGLKLINLDVRGSGSRGVYVDITNGVTIKKVEVRNTGQEGILLWDVQNAVIRDVAVSNSARGLELRDTSDSTVEDAELTGIGTPDTSGILVSETSEDNSFTDILLEDWSVGFLHDTPGADNDLTRVTSRASDYGFEFADGEANVIESVAKANSDDGLLVINDADVRVEDGKFNANDDEGIEFLDGTTGGVGGNVANNNDDTGIFVPATGVTDLGGNSATGNGIAACVNISC